MRRRSPVQPLWKDIISCTLSEVVVWSIAGKSGFHGGWFVFACVMTALTVPVFVLRQLGIIKRRQGQ